MSYNSCFIAYKNSKNNFRGIFVFNNGTIEHTGEILKEHYPSKKEFLKIVQLGDLLELKDNPENSIALERDRFYSKDSTRPMKFASLNEMFSWCKRTDYLIVDYIYVFMNGSWYATRKGFIKDKTTSELMYLEDYQPPFLF